MHSQAAFALIQHSCPTAVQCVQRAERRLHLQHRTSKLRQPPVCAVPAAQCRGPNSTKGRRSVTTAAQASTKEASGSTAAAAKSGSDSKNQIQVEVEQRPKWNIHLTVTVPANYCKKAWKRAIDEARKEFKVDGFRDSSKVPEERLIPLLGGQLGAKAAAVEALCQLTLPEAVAQTGYKKKALPDSFALEDLSDDSVAAFDVNKPFTYGASFDVFPTVRWTGDYKQLKANFDHQSELPSEDQFVEDGLKFLCSDKAQMRVVTDRGLQQGDVAVLEMHDPDTDQTKTFRMDTNDRNSPIAQNLTAAMLGAQLNEKRSIDAGTVGGESAQVYMTVKELFGRELPELTDEFVRSTGEADSIEDARRKLKETYEQGREQEQEAVQEAALGEALLDIVDVEVPESLVQEMGRNEFEHQLIEWQTTRGLSPEQLERMLTEDSLNEFIEKSRPSLESRLKAHLALKTVFQEQQLSLDPEELRTQIRANLSELQQDGSDGGVAEDDIKENVAEMLREKTAMRWLYEQATKTPAASAV